MDLPRLDKSKITLGGPLDNREEEMDYWHSRTPEERLEAVELMRRINYGDEATRGRLQRVLEIVKRPG